LDPAEVFDPNGQQILDFSANGSVEQQGITELFFESAEPSFEEQTLEELFLCSRRDVLIFRRDG
jgi:hypothetical protein